MIQYCSPKKVEAKKARIVINKLPTKRSMKRALPQIIHKAIITIAFNSDSDFSQIKHSPSKIAGLFGLERNTVKAVIKTFIKHGKDYNNICDRRHLKRNNFTMFEKKNLGQLLLS